MAQYGKVEVGPRSWPYLLLSTQIQISIKITILNCFLFCCKCGKFSHDVDMFSMSSNPDARSSLSFPYRQTSGEATVLD